MSFSSSADALRGGVAMVHQELNQALKRSVADNMWLGRLPTVAPFIPIVSEKKMYTETKKFRIYIRIHIIAIVARTIHKC